MGLEEKPIGLGSGGHQTPAIGGPEQLQVGGPEGVGLFERKEVFRDGVEKSPDSKQLTKTPPIDAPELPLPTLQGLNKGETKRKILEDIKKAKILESEKNSGGSLLTNSWMSHPSWMIAFMNAAMKLLTQISQNRYQESQRKQETEMDMAKLGIAGANISADEKKAQSDKEKLTAIGHIAGAVTATIQLVSIPGARGKAQKEAEASEVGKLRAEAKDKLAQMEQDVGLKATDGTPTAKDFTDLTAAEQKDIAAQRKTLAKLETKMHSTIETNRSMETNKLELHKKIVDGAVNGVLEVQKSLISEYESDLAKKKGMNETLQQTLNRANEGNNKSKDEDMASINKINDTIKQTSEHNQRAFQLKG